MQPSQEQEHALEIDAPIGSGAHSAAAGQSSRSTRRPAPPPRAALSPAGWEPPPPSLGSAILSRWWIVLAFALIGLAVGIFVAVQRTPVYTAESDFQVGPTNIRTQSIPGFETGAQTLTGSYARIVNTETFARQVARRTGLDPEDVLSRVSADPVPESAVLRLTSTGESEKDALGLGDAAGRELRRYLRGQERDAVTADDILKEYRSLTRKLGDLERKRGALRGERVGDPAAVSLGEIENVTSQIRSQELLVESAGIRYREAVDADDDAGQIKLIDSGSRASSDRSSYLQLLGLIGLLSGAVLGSVLALLLARRRAARG